MLEAVATSDFLLALPPDWVIQPNAMIASLGGKAFSKHNLLGFLSIGLVSRSQLRYKDESV